MQLHLHVHGAAHANLFIHRCQPPTLLQNNQSFVIVYRAEQCIPVVICQVNHISSSHLVDVCVRTHRLERLPAQNHTVRAYEQNNSTHIDSHPLTRPFTDAPWFRDAFTSISGIEHHIATQAAYWIDAFGGGREYHGGDGRINFHHHHNAASVMTAAGARRWMHHMSLTLNCDIDWSVLSPCFDCRRILISTVTSSESYELVS